jgi:hypothetical protein
MTMYLNPQSYFSNVDLSDVLVLCPSYRGAEPRAAAFQQSLAEAGALLCVSHGLSDIAMHRCVVAARGMKLLAEREHLKFVLWLDDDMLTSIESVAFLRAAVMASNQACTAYYCKRGFPHELALREVPEIAPSLVSLMLDSMLTIEVRPTLCGMGFMMLSREQFLEHCGIVPRVVRSADSYVPAICRSGPVETTWTESDPVETTWTKSGEVVSVAWFSEDISYCDSLWTLVKGVVAVPIAVAHLSTVALLPAPDAAWLA